MKQGSDSAPNDRRYHEPYKELLYKYMLLVIVSEGEDYTSNARASAYPDTPEFTEKERSTLEGVAERAWREYHRT